MNVENLTKLYEVGARILRERLPIGFRSWDCGTYCCLGGWYVREYPGVVTIHDSLDVKSHFGFPLHGDQWWNLFATADCSAANTPGPAAYAELEKRMSYLAGLIREAGGEVPTDKPNYTGIPDSVRRIFTASEAA